MEAVRVHIMKDKKDDIHEGGGKNSVLSFAVEEYSC
jgi:hypothetical protein